MIVITEIGEREKKLDNAAGTVFQNEFGRDFIFK